MLFWGIVFGFIFGFLVFWIFGVIFGVVVGYLFDKGYVQDFNQFGGFGWFFISQDVMKQQVIFFYSLFVFLGYLVKVDGQVIEYEILVVI